MLQTPIFIWINAIFRINLWFLIDFPRGNTLFFFFDFGKDHFNMSPGTLCIHILLLFLQRCVSETLSRGRYRPLRTKIAPYKLYNMFRTNAVNKQEISKIASHLRATTRRRNMFLVETFVRKT